MMSNPTQYTQYRPSLHTQSVQSINKQTINLPRPLILYKPKTATNVTSSNVVGHVDILKMAAMEVRDDVDGGAP